MSFWTNATWSEAAAFLIGVSLLIGGIFCAIVHIFVLLNRPKLRVKNRELDSAGSTGQFACPWFQKDWK